jgi:glycine/D-amino acid oxidase-like deaminating enzyme
MRIVIVGGGIVGCATAYYCARDGMRVTLLEGKTIGYGASGRNPGFLSLHCRTPGFALEMSRAGRAIVSKLHEELPGGFEFRASGGLMYFVTPEQGEVFAEFVAARRRDGLELELIDAADVRRRVPPIRDDVLGASYCAEDGQIATPSLLAALVRGAVAEGAEIREGVEVTALAGDAVETDAGHIEADAVSSRPGHGRHRFSPHTGSTSRSASSACSCCGRRRRRSGSSRSCTARSRRASTRSSATCRRGTTSISRARSSGTACCCCRCSCSRRPESC